MAEILKNFNSMPLPLAIDRQEPIALDSKTLWYDYDALVEYAESGATAYVGQLVVYVDETAGKSTAYLIQNDGTLSEVGSGASAATNVDGLSLQLTDGIIGLYGYGKEYYAYHAASGTQGEEDYVEAGYTLTQGWIAGLEPRVVEADGKLVIGWYQPNTDTLEGLNTTVGSLSTRVDDLSTDVADLEQIINGTDEVDGLVTRVDNLEGAIQNLTSAFIFKGTVATFSELTNITNPQNGWVYKVTDTEAEYAYDGTNWIELGTVYEVDLTDYAKKSDVTTALADYVKSETLDNYVLEQDFATLAGRVGTLEEALAEGGRVDQLEDQIADLETTVGTPATDEAEATGLIGQIGSLEELLGAPAQDGAEATGIYKVIDDLTYVAKVKVGETVLEPDANRQVELPIFGNSAVGLVPVAEAEGLTADNGANYFLNATGAWAIPVDARIGSLTYNENKYATVEEYIEAYVADHGMVWEAI